MTFSLSRTGWIKMLGRMAAHAAIVLVTISSPLLARAQELIYKEDFNTDGEAAGRYTATGHDVYELVRILNELNNGDQKGPISWARNTEVSFVGIPNIPARRMIFTLRPGTDATAFTPDLLKLVDSSINWLLEGKKNATIQAFNWAEVKLIMTRDKGSYPTNPGMLESRRLV